MRAAPLRRRQAHCDGHLVYPLRTREPARAPYERGPQPTDAASVLSQWRLRSPSMRCPDHPGFHSALTHWAATNSRALRGEPACRSASRSARRSGRCIIGALVGRTGRLRRRRPRRRADAGGGCRHRAAGRVCGAGAARRDAARADDDCRSSGRWFWCWRPSAGHSRPAACGRSSRQNESGSTQKLRAPWVPAVREYCSVICCRLPVAFSVVQTTLLVPGVRPCRSDALVRRPGLRRADSELGRDVARGGRRAGSRRGSLAPAPQPWRLRCGASREPQPGRRSMPRLSLRSRRNP